MSAFDPEAFMSGTLDSANSTVSEPIPVGEYLATIDKVEVRSVENRKGGESVIMDITWELQGAEDVKEQLGRDKLTCRQSIFLDMTPQGTLDMGKGKNVQLGKVRAALRQNTPGQPWAPGMLTGAGPAMVKISHRPNKDDPEIVYAEIKGVTAA